MSVENKQWLITFESVIGKAGETLTTRAMAGGYCYFTLARMLVTEGDAIAVPTDMRIAKRRIGFARTALAGGFNVEAVEAHPTFFIEIDVHFKKDGKWSATLFGTIRAFDTADDCKKYDDEKNQTHILRREGE